MDVILKLILLSRVGMLPLSLSVPIIGALSLKQALTTIELIVLAGIGISAHFFGFILNDLVDYQLDKNSPYRQKSALVSDEVKHWQAWLFVLIQIPISIFLYQILLLGNMQGLFYLGLSIALSLIYNLFSKWRWLPRILSEIALASSVALLGMSGAFIYKSNLPIEVWFYCGVLGLVLLLVNSVPSGLKDIQADSEFGARSFVISMGVSVSADGQLTFPRRLKIYMTSLQTLILICAIGLGIVYQLGVFAWGTVILLQVFAGLHTIRLTRLKHVNEFQNAFLFLGGFYNYLALVIFIWVYLPLLIQLVLGFIMIQLLSIPFRRAWSVYRQQHKLIINS